MTDPAFWAASEPLVTCNPAQEDEVAGRIRAYAASEPALEGHVVFRTSGSGGEARFVALSREALLASADAVNRHLGVGASDVWVR
ncbi:MAG: hypothetical protein ACC661_12945, partial [Verrucomicrobiales bacterium]